MSNAVLWKHMFLQPEKLYDRTIYYACRM